MKKMLLAIVGSAALGGCATVHESYTADGNKAYTLNCSGTARGWDKCLTAAGDLCGHAGYRILDRASEDGGAAVGSFSGSSGSVFGAHTQERSMMIECKAPPG